MLCAFIVNQSCLRWLLVRQRSGAGAQEQASTHPLQAAEPGEPSARVSREARVRMQPVVPTPLRGEFLVARAAEDNRLAAAG
jgi:hypothetical protein